MSKEEKNKFSAIMVLHNSRHMLKQLSALKEQKMYEVVEELLKKELKKVTQKLREENE